MSQLKRNHTLVNNMEVSNDHLDHSLWLLHGWHAYTIFLQLLLSKFLPCLLICSHVLSMFVCLLTCSFHVFLFVCLSIGLFVLFIKLSWTRYPPVTFTRCWCGKYSNKMATSCILIFRLAQGTEFFCSQTTLTILNALFVLAAWKITTTGWQTTCGY